MSSPWPLSDVDPPGPPITPIPFWLLLHVSYALSLPLTLVRTIYHTAHGMLTWILTAWLHSLTPPWPTVHLKSGHLGRLDLEVSECSFPSTAERWFIKYSWTSRSNTSVRSCFIPAAKSGYVIRRLWREIRLCFFSCFGNTHRYNRILELDNSLFLLMWKTVALYCACLPQESAISSAPSPFKDAF